MSLINTHSDLDETTIRTSLLKMRKQHGPDSKIGHRCSNLLEQLENRAKSTDQDQRQQLGKEHRRIRCRACRAVVCTAQRRSPVRHLDRLTVEVQVMAATDIPGNAIPQMVQLADRLGCDVSAKCNGVKIIALPGDDPEELAAAWEWELGGTHPVKLATAWGYRNRPRTRTNQ